jgi:hydroxypyruvate reductase
MREENTNRLREFARSTFLHALELATVASAVQQYLSCAEGILRIAGLEYRLDEYSELCLVSVGKAGETLFDAVDALLPPHFPRRAVVSAPAPPSKAKDGVLYFQGGHPEPNPDSLAAARATLTLLEQAAPDALILFLISGGASAMFELPIDDAISLSDSVSLNRVLIGCGASICEINSVRKHLSRVKGGRLAMAAGRRKKITLLISDVPDGEVNALGSGPSVPDTSTVADCMSVVQRFNLSERLPETVKHALRSGLEETPEAGQECFRDAPTVVLLSNMTFLDRMQELLSREGYSVFIDNSCDEWPYEDAAKYLLEQAQAARRRNVRGCMLSGGELSVVLPKEPGNGGRNQQFALFCAEELHSEGIVVLSAGTDGIDGVSEAAGAVADCTTASRGLSLGLAIGTFLRRFDAGSYFAAIKDQIVTGPTGNNLRDVRMLLWEDSDGSSP